MTKPPTIEIEGKVLREGVEFEWREYAIDESVDPQWLGVFYADKWYPRKPTDDPHNEWGWAANGVSVAVPVFLPPARDMTDEWRSMDSAPTDGTPLLLFARCKNARTPVILTGWFIDGEWIGLSFTRPVGIEPLAWRPRPDFPDLEKLRGDPVEEAFDAWIEQYCGKQDAGKMRFSAREMREAFKAGRDNPGDSK